MATKIYESDKYDYPVRRTVKNNGSCKLKIWQKSDGTIICLVSQLENKTGYQGISITNAAESIATHIVNETLPSLKIYNVPVLEYVEHYSKRGTANTPIPESYDLVTFTWFNLVGKETVASDPEWKAIKKLDFMKLIENESKETISISEFRKRFFEKAFQFVNDEVEFQLREIFDEVIDELKYKK